MKFTASDITMYIPCYNTAGSIERCLKSVLNMKIRPSRLILIDDGSNPPLESTLEELKIPLPSYASIIKQPCNMGLSAGRNTALESCNTALIASIDSDVEVSADWLEKLLHTLNDKKVSGVAGRLDEFFQENPGDKWRAVHMAQHWGDKALENPRFLYGANNLFIADDLREAGGYIRTLKTNYEDMSMSESLYKLGKKLYYSPDAQAWHLRHDTEVSILPGFWKWFHAKAVLAGDFKNPDKLIERIEKVAFGIFKYRSKKDLEAGRIELYRLDSMIPWVFCALDLHFASSVEKLNVPEFPNNELLEKLQQKDKEFLLAILKTPPRSSSAEKWHQDYLQAFNDALSSASTEFQALKKQF